jgi:hypothetical protein
MTKLLAVLMFLASSAQASPYFRPLDPHHIQTDELAVFSPFNSAPAIGVMDIASRTAPRTALWSRPDCGTGSRLSPGCLLLSEAVGPSRVTP